MSRDPSLDYLHTRPSINPTLFWFGLHLFVGPVKRSQSRYLYKISVSRDTVNYINLKNTWVIDEEGTEDLPQAFSRYLNEMNVK